MNETLPARAKCRIEASGPWIEETPMDIALLVAAVVFFFWQTVTD